MRGGAPPPYQNVWMFEMCVIELLHWTCEKVKFSGDKLSVVEFLYTKYNDTPHSWWETQFPLDIVRVQICNVSIHTRIAWNFKKFMPCWFLWVILTEYTNVISIVHSILMNRIRIVAHFHLHSQFSSFFCHDVFMQWTSLTLFIFIIFFDQDAFLSVYLSLNFWCSLCEEMQERLNDTIEDISI